MDVAYAIADPVRRDIMMLLKPRPLPAGEIAGYFEITRPAVSRHLRVLRECGLVVAEAHGRERVYRLDTTPLAPLEQWLVQIHDQWSAALDALETEVYRTRRDNRNSRVTRKDKSA